MSINIVTLHVPVQNKCELYWHDQVDKPFDVGRDFTVVTTAYRGFADYDVRDMTVQCVSWCVHTNVYSYLRMYMYLLYAYIHISNGM